MVVTKLDKDILNEACCKVIDSLKTYPPEYKIAALNILVDSFPLEYMMATKDKVNK